MDEKLRQNIIQELALTEASQEEVDEVVAGLGGLILELVMTQVTDILDDDAVIILEKILTAKDSQDKQDHLDLFLEEYVPDIEDIIALCSKEVLEEYKKLP